MFSFKILKKSKKSFARLGIIETPYGEILTPAFTPIATQAAIKGLTFKDLNEIGVQTIFCNTYHLFLRPGHQLIKKFGGLHKFMNFNKPIFTDSGGFQVFSLGKGLEQGVGKIANIFPGETKTTYKPREKSKVKIIEEGVIFYSHLDGSEKFLSPELSIKIQEDLGGDFVFAFDECTSPLDDYEYTKKAMERTHRWAIRSLKAFKSKKQVIYGIIQGGYFKDLRIESTKFINSLDFWGIGIGGILGNTKKDMYKILSWTIPLLDENKPRHLLGIGSTEDIEKIVKYGIDTFDCVEPTRLARHGAALLRKGRLNLNSAKYKNSKEPIDKTCQCYTCQNFSRGYLRHLIVTKEITGIILLAYHNLWLMEKIISEIREKIKKDII